MLAKLINMLSNRRLQLSHMSIYMLSGSCDTDNHCVPRLLKLGLVMALHVLDINYWNSQKIVQQTRFSNPSPWKKNSDLILEKYEDFGLDFFLRLLGNERHWS